MKTLVLLFWVTLGCAVNKTITHIPVADFIMRDCSVTTALPQGLPHPPGTPFNVRMYFHYSDDVIKRLDKQIEAVEDSMDSIIFDRYPPDTLPKQVVIGDSVLLDRAVASLQRELIQDQLLATLSQHHHGLMSAKLNHLDSLLSANNTDDLKRNVDVFRREFQQYTNDLQKYNDKRKAFATAIEAERRKRIQSAADRQRVKNLFRTIEEALLQDGIITKGQKYAFVINAKEMIVNGVKQAPQVLERYKTLARQFDADVDQPGYGNISKN